MYQLTKIQRPTKMQQQILTPADVQRIKAEYQKYLDDEQTLHNKQMHARILATWKANSPRMYLRLRTQGVLDPLAFVCQQRMWEESDQLEKSGMAVTDAREQAERDNLMLEPESQSENESA